MTIRTNLGVLLGFWVLVAAARAAACGGGGVTTVSTSTTDGVVANAQRVIFSVRGLGTSGVASTTVTTEVVAQIGVAKTSDDYGVLIPTPVPPTLDPEPISSDDLDVLDEATRPVIRRYTTTYDHDDSGGGCTCLPVSGSDDGGSRTTNDNVVAVSAPVGIGPVTAVVLQSSDASALSAWLDQNGFAIPDDQADLVSTYVHAGSSFIALKRSDSVADAGPSSVGIHYTLQGDYRQVSLRFARLGAAPKVAFTVFVDAPTPVAVSAPGTNLGLLDLDPTLIDRDYSGAVAKAVAGMSPAFVLEGTFSSAYVAPLLSPQLKSILTTYGTLTRASTVVAREELVADAVFNQRSEWRTHQVDVNDGQVTMHYGSASALPALLLARALRRLFARREAKRA